MTIKLEHLILGIFTIAFIVGFLTDYIPEKYGGMWGGGKRKFTPGFQSIICIFFYIIFLIVFGGFYWW